MILYVMRHGPAEDRSPTGRDFDRRLTPAGASIVERAAERLLEARGAPLSRIVASPLARAQQTARIVASRVGEGRGLFATSDDLAGEVLPLALVDEAAVLGIDTLFIGHQPTVEALVQHLAHDHDPKALRAAFARGFSTAMIAAVELLPLGDSGRSPWKLAFLLDPRSPS